MHIFGIYVPQYLFWAVLGILFLIIELSTTALVSVWFIPGTFFAAITSVFTDKVLIQLVVFLIVSLCCFPISKKLYEKRLKIKNLNSNDNILSKTGVVVETVTPLEGRILMGDISWKAVSESGSIPVNTIVQIKNVDNLTLTVVAITN